MSVPLRGREFFSRAAKDWAEAGRLRDDIQAAGFRLVDTPDGPRLDPIS